MSRASVDPRLDCRVDRRWNENWRLRGDRFSEIAGCGRRIELHVPTRWRWLRIHVQGSASTYTLTGIYTLAFALVPCVHPGTVYTLPLPTAFTDFRHSVIAIWN